MATTTSKKRSASSDSEKPQVKRTKTSAKATGNSIQKLRTICSTVNPTLSSSPNSCKRFHGTNDERACAECWEAYLSMAVEEQRAEDIQCMFCDSLMPEAEVKRYDAKLNSRKKQTSQARCVNSRMLRTDGTTERSKSSDYGNSYLFIHQDHDSEVDGRLFNCKYCDFETCTTCDVPEHPGETCETYQHRTAPIQDAIPMREKIAKKVVKNCPECKAYWLLGDGGCGYVKCIACQYRFCQRCMIPWVGEGSAYLVGKEAHCKNTSSDKGKICTYRDRATVSAHALKNRFE